jgi:hypothetical protein
MPSRALIAWQARRSVRLAELLRAHSLVCAAAQGGRWQTNSLNAALVLRLASEFQGFVRDLHNEASDVFAAWAVPGNPEAQAVVKRRLIARRELDRGNANPGNIGSDFRMFGMDIWFELKARDPLTAQHNHSLERLNAARNALAHSDETGLSKLRAEGWPIVLRTYLRWHKDLGALAVNMDAEVSDNLARVFNGRKPW